MHNSAKSKCCKHCKRWRLGHRGCTAKGMAAKQRKEAAKAIVPKLKKSKAGRKWKYDPPGISVDAVIGRVVNTGHLPWSFKQSLNWWKHFGDTHKTIDDKSLDTNQTAAHETHDEIIKILDQEDDYKGDSRLSDGEGEGCEIAQSFLDGMLNVE